MMDFSDLQNKHLYTSNLGSMLLKQVETFDLKNTNDLGILCINGVYFHRCVLRLYTEYFETVTKYTENILDCDKLLLIMLRNMVYHNKSYFKNEKFDKDVVLEFIHMLGYINISIFNRTVEPLITDIQHIDILELALCEPQNTIAYGYIADFEITNELSLENLDKLLHVCSNPLCLQTYDCKIASPVTSHVKALFNMKKLEKNIFFTINPEINELALNPFVENWLTYKYKPSLEVLKSFADCCDDNKIPEVVLDILKHEFVDY